MSNHTWRAAPLHWGHGPDILEVFIEPTCPFCVRALKKMHPLLERVGEDRLTIKLRLHQQPWHLYSAVVTRCIIAASTLENGRDRAWKVIEAVMGHREEFVFKNHATGPNRQTTPDEVIAWLEALSGVELAAAFDIPDLDDEAKWHAKYSRQNGIHVSPTFILNGLIQPQMGSGDAVEDWADIIAASQPR